MFDNESYHGNFPYPWPYRINNVKRNSHITKSDLQTQLHKNSSDIPQIQSSNSYGNTKALTSKTTLNRKMVGEGHNN
jgi:hypothetical protein